MKFGTCLTVDYRARHPSRKELLHVLSKLFLPEYRTVAYYRLALCLRNGPLRLLTYPLGSLLLIRLARIPGVEFRNRLPAGIGLLLPHPHDIVIGHGVRIGRNVTIYNGVTLGARTILDLDNVRNEADRYPTIEDDVTIMAGAKVIGPVVIGRNSIIGANAVVRNSFAPDSVIAGVPARLIRTLGKNGS